MPPDLILANYAELENIAKAFDSGSDRVRGIYQSLDGHLANLKVGGWEGDSAETFFRELDRDLMPSVGRLHQALSQAARTTREISRIFREAEEQAARQLRAPDIGDGDSAGMLTVLPPTITEKIAPRFRRRARARSSYRYVSADSDVLYQGDEDDTPISDAEREALYNSLAAYMWTTYPLFVYYLRQLGREPTLEELLAEYFRFETTSPEDMSWGYILSPNGLDFLLWINGEAIRRFPEFWAESWQHRNPEDYARAWESFRTWFEQDGIRNVLDVADASYAFKDWLNGEGEFWMVFLAAAPLSLGTLTRIINRTDSPALRNALEELAGAGSPVYIDDVIQQIMQHSDDVAAANLVRLMNLTGDGFTDVLRGLDQRAVIELIMNPAILNGIEAGADISVVQRAINVNVLNEIAPQVANVTDSLNLDATNRILRILDTVDKQGLEIVPQNVQSLVDALGAEGAGGIINRLEEPGRLTSLLTDSNYANRFILPNADNASFFVDTFEYNGFRRLFDAGDVPTGTANPAQWINGQNSRELNAAFSAAQNAGVDLTVRIADEGEALHHIVAAAEGRFPSAISARDRLMTLGIHPNSVYNGVGIISDVHQYVHNEAYYNALDATLRNMNTTQEAIDFLDSTAAYIDALPSPTNADEARFYATQITQYIQNYGG